ncbi:MAG: M24 family metallopeptidase, partial [Actinobacteria bacterium]|nr:M24 family metallopeptidase [Actinomycetota bacterium]
VDEVVWTGALPPLAERAERVGVADTRPQSELAEVVEAACSAGRRVMWLPPYRAEQTLRLAELTGLPPGEVAEGMSVKLIRAVVDQRSHKDADEIREIERAVATSVAMHEAALRTAAPGVRESDIAAQVEHLARAAGGRSAFPVIATVHGETLHNHAQTATLSEGDLFLLDSGAESELGYAGDLTTTWPVSSGLDDRQAEVFALLGQAYDAAVAGLAPGMPNREVHFAACRAIFEGMKGL